ncbi:MAG TPA: glycosyltransferase 87 family protein [bacterium]|nr:glycosyltransferase 87 family protein [bacterium]
MILAVAALCVLLGLLAAENFCLWAAGRNLPWAHATFLFDPSARFSDLLSPLAMNRNLDPYFNAGIKPMFRGWISNYFPFFYQVLGALRPCGPPDIIRGFIALSAGLYLLASFLAGALYGEGIPGALAMALFLAVLALAGYPFLVAVDRGNLETVVAALCFLSMLFLCKDKPVAGALFLALAIAVKGYPAVLCLLFVKRGHWRCGMLAALVALALSLEAFACLSGGFLHNVVGLFNGLRGYLAFSGSGNAAAFASDPYDGLLVLGFWRPEFLPRVLPCIATLWQAAKNFVVAGCLAYALLARAPFHRCLLAATLGMMLVPGLIADYKLLHLLPVLFFMAVEEEPWTLPDRVAFASLLALLVSKNYYFLGPDHSVSCLINPLLLLLLLGTLALDQASWRMLR